MKKYQVNETFYSLQGEGARAGSANVFVRFSGCNLTCRQETEGFDCDTEFVSGRPYDADALADACTRLLPDIPRQGVGVIFTGGEPALQLDEPLLDAFRVLGFGFLCIETNGTKPVPSGLWVSCSPKTAEHTLRVGEGRDGHVNELRYVRRAGMGIPRPALQADSHFLSPAFRSNGTIDPDDLAWCIQLVRENPSWRLSLQSHKFWGVR